jgi:mRNA interferase MazF
MQKDFDEWNKAKKLIHFGGTPRFYREREIWWCSIGLNVGFEEDGKGISYGRPVLVIKGFSRQVCLTVPLTTSAKKSPYHISVGTVAEVPAFAIISQIRLVDTRRFANRIGVLDKEMFEVIRKTIKDML